jgi:large subunit ribosomal protein L30e
MVDNAHLAKVLKEAMKGGKSALGAKESLAAVKGSKAILCSRSLQSAIGSKLRAQAKEHEVPVVELSQSSAELGRLVGRPYKVSAIALRGVSDADVKQLTR